VTVRRALVTGGAGFIGSHLVERLLAVGIEPAVIDDLSMGRRENVPAEAELHEADVRDADALRRAMRGADVVFHEAAKVSIRNSFDGFAGDASVNVMGTINVLRIMAEEKVRRLIYASSMAVYGRNSLPLDEDGRLEPISPYGVGKLASEKYALLMAGHAGLECVVLRYFNTYGPRQTWTPYVGVITIFLNRFLGGEAPMVFGDGEQVRDYIHVGDVVEANLRAMEWPAPCGVFNVGTGTGTSVNGLARLLAARLGSRLLPVHVPSMPGEPADSVAGTEKAERILGFKARARLEDRIDEVVAYIRSGNK
jgi:UDP-glucose 4-epimerase